MHPACKSRSKKAGRRNCRQSASKIPKVAGDMQPGTEQSLALLLNCLKCLGLEAGKIFWKGQEDVLQFGYRWRALLGCTATHSDRKTK